MHFDRNDRDILSFICLICLLPTLGFTTIILEVNDIKIMSFNDAFFRPPVTVVSSLTYHNINIIICAHKNMQLSNMRTLVYIFSFSLVDTVPRMGLLRRMLSGLWIEQEDMQLIMLW